MSCASTPNDVIGSLLPSAKLFITSPFLEGCLENWSLQIGSSPFLFFFPGFCYHSSIVRNISSLLFQLTSSQLTVPINQLLDRLLIRDDNTVSMFVIFLKMIISSVFAEYLQNTLPKSNALLSDLTTRLEEITNQ